MNSILYSKIARRGSEKEKIAQEIMNNPEWIQTVVDGLSSDKADIKYGCEKVLRIISEKKPELLYERFDFFVKMLDHENSFLKWGAIITISNLVKVDSENKFAGIFEKYFSPIPGPVMITAANTIAGAARIAVAKPELADRIVQQILKVEQARYQTDECRNIACGHAVDSFSQFYPLVHDKKAIVKFVKKQVNNSRAAVRKRAEKFLQKLKVQNL